MIYNNFCAATLLFFYFECCIGKTQLLYLKYDSMQQICSLVQTVIWRHSIASGVAREKGPKRRKTKNYSSIRNFRFRFVNYVRHNWRRISILSDICDSCIHGNVRKNKIVYQFENMTFFWFCYESRLVVHILTFFTEKNQHDNRINFVINVPTTEKY